MKITALAKKALTVAAASAALMTAGVGTAAADIGTGNGGYAHTDVTCFSYHDIIRLSVQMTSEQDYYPQNVSYRAKFFRWNTSTRQWDYRYYYNSPVLNMGYTGDVFQTGKLTPGSYYVQMTYVWHRADRNSVGSENIQKYSQDNNSYHGSSTMVSGYCNL